MRDDGDELVLCAIGPLQLVGELFQLVTRLHLLGDIETE